MALPAGVTKLGSFKGEKGRPGTFDSVTAETVPADQPADAVISGKFGEHLHLKNPRGLPGVNAVENDTAVATYIGAEDSEVRRALEGLGVVKVGVRRFGTFSKTATAAVNGAAMQAANDYVASRGGGVIALPPGTFPCVGVVQDSRVLFEGARTTLVHPGSGNTTPVIDARVRNTTGTITGGSVTLTVADATGIEEGTIVAVRAAGGLASTQYTTLAGVVTDTQTTGITLTNPAAYPPAGWLLVDEEIIEYTGLSAGALTGVTRGAFGTNPAGHAAGAIIGFAVRHYGKVEAVIGNTLMLDRPAHESVKDAEVSFGIRRPGLRDITIDGNLTRPQMSFGAMVIRWSLVSEGFAEDIGAVNAESAFMLTRGTRGCDLIRLRAHDCAGPEQSRGASVWVYQGCRENNFHMPRITGDTWTGIYFDDRTSVADEWMAPNDNNSITDVSIDVKRRDYAPAISLTASNGNTVIGGMIRGASVGIVIDDGTGQIYTADGAKPTAQHNKIGPLQLDVINPWTLPVPGNVLMGVTYSTAALANGTNAGNNLMIGCSRTPGGAPLTVNGAPTGGSAAPGYAFAGDADTGMYSDSANMVGLAAGAVAVMRAFATEARFYGTGKQTLIHANGYLELTEVAGDPTNAPADKARLFVRDNGNGKTQVCVRFPSGATQVLSTEA